MNHPKKVSENVQQYLKLLTNKLAFTNREQKDTVKQLTYELLDVEHENILLRQILASSSDPIIIFNQKEKIIYVNKAWENLTGYLFDEVDNKKISFLYSSKTPRKVNKKLREALLRRTPFTSEEIVNIKKDGTEYQIYSSIFPVKTDNKAVLFVQIQHDITERKERERLEHNLANLVKFSNDAIIGLNLHLIITTWNPAAEKLYGYTQEQIIGKSIRILVPHHLLGEERSITIEHTVARYETIRKRKNGSLIDVSVTVSPINDDEGRIAGYSAIHHDITERKKIENRLRESEQLFRAIFNSMYQFTYLLAPDGMILEVNNASLQLIQMKHEDIIGQNFFRSPLFPKNKEEQKKLKLALKQVEKGKFVRYNMHFDTIENISLVIDLSIKPITDENGKIILILTEGRDISEWIKLEEQKSNFLSIASHELKTPITTLKLMISMFLKKMKKAGQSPTELELIDHELDRLTNLITELLDVSRIESGKMNLLLEKQDLAVLVCQVIKKMKLVAEKHKLVVGKMAKLDVYLDTNRISEVITNIISNAIRYSPENSTITIELYEKNDFAIVSFHDEGIGIPQKVQSTIFNRFYQINTKSKKGFGLGLFISKEIIKKHKGKIWVQSTPGKGSTFFFSLPLVKS